MHAVRVPSIPHASSLLDAANYRVESQGHAANQFPTLEARGYAWQHFRGVWSRDVAAAEVTAELAWLDALGSRKRRAVALPLEAAPDPVQAALSLALWAMSHMSTEGGAFDVDLAGFENDDGNVYAHSGDGPAHLPGSGWVLTEDEDAMPHEYVCNATALHRAWREALTTLRGMLKTFENTQGAKSHETTQSR